MRGERGGQAVGSCDHTATLFLFYTWVFAGGFLYSLAVVVVFRCPWLVAGPVGPACRTETESLDRAIGLFLACCMVFNARGVGELMPAYAVVARP